MAGTPTIRDVAAKARVSVGTASRALSGGEHVAPKTLEAVRSAAAELNYVPNALIRSLQTGKSRIVGLYLWRLDLEHAASAVYALTLGLVQSLTEINYDALIYHHHPFERHETISYFMDGRADGVILAPGALEPEELGQLARSGVKVVALYDASVPTNVACVDIDNRGGVTDAIRSLAELGHTRVALIAPEYTHDYRERRRAWEAAAVDLGLQADPRLGPRITSEHGDEVPQAVAALLDLPEPPTAIVAGDDLIAETILEALRGLGVSVPGSMSVVGFDGHPEVVDKYDLSGVVQPALQVGMVAGRMMGRLLAGDDPADCRIVLPVQFVERGTTASAPR